MAFGPLQSALSAGSVAANYMDACIGRVIGDPRQVSEIKCSGNVICLSDLQTIDLDNIQRGRLRNVLDDLTKDGHAIDDVDRELRSMRQQYRDVACPTVTFDEYLKMHSQQE